MNNWGYFLLSKEGLCFLLDQVSRPSRRVDQGCAVRNQSRCSGWSGVCAVEEGQPLHSWRRGRGLFNWVVLGPSCTMIIWDALIKYPDQPSEMPIQLVGYLSSVASPGDSNVQPGIRTRVLICTGSYFLTLLLFQTKIICSYFLTSLCVDCHMIWSQIWHGIPLQYSCLENPMDRGARLAAIHRVAQSQTRLKGLSMHTCCQQNKAQWVPLSCVI